MSRWQSAIRKPVANGEGADQRRDRQLRELRALHAAELAKAHADGLREGERRALARPVAPPPAPPAAPAPARRRRTAVEVRALVDTARRLLADPARSKGAVARQLGVSTGYLSFLLELYR